MAKEGGSVIKTRLIIVECCFLQNPITVLLGRHNATPPFINRYITALGELIKPLSPLLIYLDHGDVWQTIEALSRERPKQWLDFVIDYVAKHGYGQANQLTGFHGLVQFLEARRELELEIIARLDLPSRIFDSSDFNPEQCQKEIKEFLLQIR